MAHDIVIGGTFTVPSRGMISATAMTKTDDWNIAIGKTGTIWLYHPERSGVWASGGPQSRGCGGSTVSFKLAGGLGSIDLVGPWHSNSDAFFKDTGINVRDKHVTWGCIGTGRSFETNSGAPQITGVLYFDTEPVVGLFERIDLLAWEMQQKDPTTPLFMYWESEGGSSHGTVGKPYSLRVRDGDQPAFEDIF